MVQSAAVGIGVYLALSTGAHGQLYACYVSFSCINQSDGGWKLRDAIYR